MPKSKVVEQANSPEKNDFFSDPSFAENNRIILPEPKKSIPFNRQTLLKVFPWVAIVVVLAAGGSYGFWQYNKAKMASQPGAELAKTAEPTPEQQLEEVITKVSNLMFLPEGAKPTLATVKDPAKLQNEAFFARAEVGDKVLIYNVAKQAILYSEKMNKIKAVAPIFPNEQAAPESGSVAGESIIETTPPTEPAQSPSNDNNTSGNNIINVQQ